MRLLEAFQAPSSLLVAFALLAAAGVELAPATRVIGRADVRELHERIRKDTTVRDLAVENAKRQLERESPSNAEALVPAIRARLRRELDAHVDSLLGSRARSVDDAYEKVKRRERVLCFDAVTWPAGFARGQLLTFVVDQADADLLTSEVAELVRVDEASLRSTVRRMVSEHALSVSDSRALRDHCRERGRAAARDAIAEIRGEPFFSKADVEAYVENAVANELSALERRIADPAARPALVEEARSAFARP